MRSDRSSTKLAGLAISLLTVLASLTPTPAYAGDKAVVAPPFSSTFAHATAGATRCEADTAGHFVASVSSTDPTTSDSCQAGGSIEVLVPREGATLTVSWHINDAFGADLQRAGSCGASAACGGDAICVSLDSATTAIEGCDDVGVATNTDRTMTVPFPGRGRYVISPWVSAVVVTRELPREARIDAVVTSVSVDYTK